jgi:hypothetical protein
MDSSRMSAWMRRSEGDFDMVYVVVGKPRAFDFILDDDKSGNWWKVK